MGVAVQRTPGITRDVRISRGIGCSGPGGFLKDHSVKKSFSSKTIPEKSKKIQLPAGVPEIISDFGSLLGVGGRKRKMPHQGINIQDKPVTPILAAWDRIILEEYDEKC